MKFYLGALTCALLAAPAFAGYDATYYIGNGWSGEYPNGFSVAAKKFSTKGRGAMDSAAAQDVTCALPYLATYHPWNTKRPANFKTATKIVPMKAKKNLQLFGDGDKKIAVKKGEKFDYLQSGAEGEFQVRFKGKEYTAEAEVMDQVTYDDALMTTPADEWIEISCQNGPQAWLLLSDLSTQTDEGLEFIPGLRDWQIDGQDFGEARDLTPKDLQKKKTN